MTSITQLHKSQTLRLRDYQRAAVEATRSYVRDGNGTNPLVVLPTGAGKSLVIASLAESCVLKGGRVLMMTHRKELVRQNRDKLLELAPWLRDRVGIYSAGLREKRLDRPITYANVQSLAHVAKRGHLPHYDLVIVDEAHRVPPLEGTARGESQARVRQYADTVSALRASCEREGGPYFIGLTATPYRHGEGYIHQMKGQVFDGVAIDIDMARLVRDGYLAPLICATDTHTRGSLTIDEKRLKVARGEFTPGSQEEQLIRLAAAICQNAVSVKRRENRRACMIFTPTIRITLLLRDLIADQVGRDRVVAVTSDDPGPERDAALAAFKAREGPDFIVSCGVLTEGFDAPHVDLIVMCRATQSAALWVQICGRGSRVAPGKRNCLVLDHGANLTRHGPANSPVVGVFRRAEEKREAANKKKKAAAARKNELERLTLNPEVNARLMVDARDMVWQRVLGYAADVRNSHSSGLPQVVVTLTLEGQPRTVPAYFRIDHLKRKRSFIAQRWRRLMGRHTNFDGGESPVELAHAMLPLVRRVVVGVESGRRVLAHIARGGTA